MTRRLALIVVLVLVPLAAHARDVYFNGVKLDASMLIKSQTFPACEVRFDDNGDIHITAKGFKVEVQPAGPEAAPPEKLTKRYWLVSKQTRRGMAQYEVDVFVNGTFVKKVRSVDDAVVLEVTKYVKPGLNKLRLVATKVIGDKRLSTSPNDALEVVLGEGNVGGGTVSIDKPWVTYRRTAHETQNFSDEYTFTGR